MTVAGHKDFTKAADQETGDFSPLRILTVGFIRVKKT